MRSVVGKTVAPTSLVNTRAEVRPPAVVALRSEIHSEGRENLAGMWLA